MNNRLLKPLLLLSLLAGALCPADNEVPKRMDWWKKAKFGMFIHWGAYSKSGGEWKGETNHHEWLQFTAKIPLAEYTEYARTFDPKDFDPDQWVTIAKNAGMKYMIITSKHHDGIAMYDSKASDHNIVKLAGLDKEPIRQLAEACRKQGIRFGVYYSLGRDWEDPDVPTGKYKPGWRSNLIDFPDEKNKVFNRYFKRKALPQVRELLTDFGPIDVLWFDTPELISPAESKEMLELARSLQPDCIVNQRVGNGLGDYGTPEQTIPSEASSDPWETCMTLNGHWSYNKADNKWKSAGSLIRNLADITSKGGNYLLNVGPTGEGVIPEPSVERLSAIGAWLKINGEAIYGTTASPFAQLDWGRCTKKVHADGTNLYLHVFDWPQNGELLVPGLKNDVKDAYLLADGRPLKTRQDDEGTIVTLPGRAPDSINSVVVLLVSRILEIEKVGRRRSRDGSVVLAADAAYIHNNEGSADARLQDRGDDPDNIGYWLDPQASVEWSFKVAKPGTFEVIAEIALEEDSRFVVGLGDQKITARAASTGGYAKYKELSLGTLRIEAAGDHTLRIKPDPKHWKPINLRQVELKVQK